MLPVISNPQMAFSTSSTQSLCRQQVFAPLPPSPDCGSLVWQFEWLPLGFFSKPESPALLCFPSNGNYLVLLLALVVLLALLSSSLCPFFETFCKSSLLLCVVLSRRCKCGWKGHLSKYERTDIVPGTVYSCQSYIVPSQILRRARFSFPMQENVIFTGFELRFSISFTSK